MPAPHVLVVGAGLAGLRTAERLRRLGHAGPITMVGSERIHPYDRPPLSKALLTQPDEPGATLLRSEDAYDELDLDLRLGRSAIRLDPESREVHLDDGSRLKYDELVIATGSAPRTISAWSGRTGVHVLRTFEDCLALRRDLATSEHATVVGGGVLGCEIAASARSLGLSVHLVEAQPQLLVRVVGAQIGAAVARLHERHGAVLHLGATVERLNGDTRVSGVVLDDGTQIRTDVLVVAVGASPDTRWLESSGLAVDDGVLCDRTGAASLPHVWAVGDVARMPAANGEGTVRLEHWTAAGDTAARVAANIVADEPEPLTEVPYFWSDQYDVRIQCLGLPRPDDRLTVVSGDLGEGPVLGVFDSDGRVTAAVGIGLPAQLARCRKAVADRMRLPELLEQSPWERRKMSA